MFCASLLIFIYNYYRTQVLFFKPEEVGVGAGGKLVTATDKKSESAYDFFVTSRKLFRKSSIANMSNSWMG